MCRGGSCLCSIPKKLRFSLHLAELFLQGHFPHFLWNMIITFCFPSLPVRFSWPRSRTTGIRPALEMLNMWHWCLLPSTTFYTSSIMFALTFEEDNLVVAGSLIDCVQAVQVEWQAPPETVNLSRLEGDQVLIASQSPEVLAWRDRLDITEPHTIHLRWGVTAG